ncbi:hypothetical protein JNUCC0626_12845 [Lentzea sp. JNUCC 0626]|uniref:hypothetical protein n=1 Tax=Lentzea sp. JNUCC 0626 TaxID=3367513 RepID=UPI0037486D34
MIKRLGQPTELRTRLVVRGGLVDREVGDAVFITAKTVEHHVTRSDRATTGAAPGLAQPMVILETNP